MRKIWIFVLFILCSALQPLLPQTATGLNHGLTISQNTATNAFNVSWWGSSDKIYYLQHSSDLINWSYLPFLEEGTDAALSWGLSTNADRLFFRVVPYAHPGGDPKQYDSDGDGFSDWDELYNETDFRDYYNGILPTLKISEGGGQRGGLGEVLPLPLTVMLEPYYLPNAPVRFSVPNGEALLSADGVNGWATSVELCSDPSSALAKAYIKLPSQLSNNNTSTLRASVTTGGQTVEVLSWAGIEDHQLLPPLNLLAKPMGPDRVELSWTLTHPERPTTVEMSLDHGATWEVKQVVPPGVSTLSLTGLERNRLHKFCVRSGGKLP